MALCNDWCCDEQKREAMLAESREAVMLRRMEFVKHLAQQRGQTVERAIPAGEALPRPDGSEKFKSDDKPVVAPRCKCAQCTCDTIATITHPGACAECLRGWHRQVA